MADLVIGTQPVYIPSRGAEDQKTIVNVAGATLYYGDDSGVSPNSFDGSLGNGQSYSFSESCWIVSASSTRISIREAGGLSISGKGHVNHSANANVARPSAYASVEWVGSVEPTNATNGDTWIDTSG
jgi:hypothetical protein